MLFALLKTPSPFTPWKNLSQPPRASTSVFYSRKLLLIHSSKGIHSWLHPPFFQGKSENTYLSHTDNYLCTEYLLLCGEFYPHIKGMLEFWSPVSQNVALSATKVFTEVIKLKRCHYGGVLTKRGHLDAKTDMHTKRTPCKDERQTSGWCIYKDCQQTTWSSGRDSPQSKEPIIETVDFGLLASRTVRQDISVV